MTKKITLVNKIHDNFTYILKRKTLSQYLPSTKKCRDGKCNCRQH